MNINDVNNKVAYFNKVIKNMENKEYEKEKIKKNAGFEEYNMFPSEMENMCFSEDEYFNGNLLDWIELFDDINLYKAVKRLSKEEQILLSYVFYKEKTQTGVAKIYGISQPAAFYKLSNIIKKLRLFLFKK